MTVRLTRAALRRVRFAARFQYPAQVPDAIIDTACRHDLTRSQKMRRVGAAHRAAMGRAIAEAELELAVLGAARRAGR
jgi:archaeosine-15-forming tRNA-guanine transglycosylase